MIKEIRLDKRPTTLKIVVATKTKQKIWLKVADPTKPNTYYIKRYANIVGKQSFFVNMPIAPNEVDVIVYNAKNGLVKKRQDIQSVRH